MATGGSTVADEYEWERLPDMLVPRCYSVAAYHEGKLYVFGEFIMLSNGIGFLYRSRVCGLAAA